MNKIDLSKERVLFSCLHIDELKVYKMIENKEKITPNNVPTCDLELALIANPKSPYGFKAIYKDNKGKLDYMGVGHSGVCSIITALLKELEVKEQKCKRLKKQLEQQKALTETYNTCYRAKHNDIDGKLFSYKQALDEIEEKCLKYQTCIIILKEDILDSINKIKDGK